MNFVKHVLQVQQYLNHRVELHNYIKKITQKQRKQETERYNWNIKYHQHNLNDYVILHQKNIEKLKFKWQKLFIISNYESERRLSFTLIQLSDRNIKNTFHESDLKIFQSQYKYLAENEILDDFDKKY